MPKDGLRKYDKEWSEKGAPTLERVLKKTPKNSGTNQIPALEELISAKGKVPHRGKSSKKIAIQTQTKRGVRKTLHRRPSSRHDQKRSAKNEQ